MPTPQSITADALEILVSRELRRIGIQPVNLRRRNFVRSSEIHYTFDLLGRLEAYDRRWSVLIECRNQPNALGAADVHGLRARATAAAAASAMLFTTSAVELDAAATARSDAVALLRVVDAQDALIAAGMIQVGQLPAWLPEFTIEAVTTEGTKVPQANDPEMLLRELRPRG
jgi:hypothetical protein